MRKVSIRLYQISQPRKQLAHYPSALATLPQEVIITKLGPHRVRHSSLQLLLSDSLIYHPSQRIMRTDSAASQSLIDSQPLIGVIYFRKRLEIGTIPDITQNQWNLWSKGSACPSNIGKLLL